MKKITILLVLLILINVGNAQSYLQKGNDIDGEVSDDWLGHSLCMPDKETIAIGAPQNGGNGVLSGQVRIYRWNGSSWMQKGIDIDGEAVDDRSGTSVSMPDSNTVSIGALQNDGNGFGSGHVRIYKWEGSAWMQKGIDIDGEAAEDHAYVVSMPDSNTIAIGAPRNNGSGTGSGHVRIYYWNGSVWVQKGIDIDGEAINDNSGSVVSMPDSNTVAIGAQWNDGNGLYAGHVRIYRWNGGVWVQKGIDLDGEAIGDAFGSSISMTDSNTVAIGAIGNDGNGVNAGHVRVYSWNGSAWIQKGIDIDGEMVGDFSGSSVSMPDSNTLAVGAFNNDGIGVDAGHVRIYRWNGNVWVQKGIDIDGEASDDESGFSVSMSDSNTIAIGAYLNDGNGGQAGQTRVYSFVSNVGVLVNSFDNYINVYPNPTNGEISIDLGTNYNDLNVIIRNQLGQEILKKKYGGTNFLQLNLPEEIGMYFIEVKSSDKKVLVKVINE